ncbi:hypothetical protein LYNGBM3L_71190 [Moorena producens 3L]|uniref:Uncharacterized protein n=1 Tax=Moorena producens 3L TaxID=489825 RepID=F4Y3J3_9CYAN|nr:hypothetical protein LYNGBM3L_71190 [Moorena producens 3L]
MVVARERKTLKTHGLDRVPTKAPKLVFLVKGRAGHAQTLDDLFQYACGDQTAGYTCSN